MITYRNKFIKYSYDIAPKNKNIKNAFLYYDFNTGKQVRGIISY